LDAVFKQAGAAATAAPAAKKASAGGASGSSVKVSGFQTSDIFQQIKDGLPNAPASEIKKINAVFQFDIKNGSKVQSWTLDMKNPPGSLVLGAVTGGKPDIVISTSDADFMDLANGKTTGQKAFMQGKLKVKGNIMLATKLDSVLKGAKAKL
jgi:putative sterol carrier protein